MIPAAKSWAIALSLIVVVTSPVLAQRSDEAARLSGSPLPAGWAVIEAQIHAPDPKKHGGYIGAEESNSIYRRYLADIGNAVTHSGPGGYQAAVPIGSGGH